MDGLLNITFDDYTSVPVMMPSRSEQKQIANYIHTLNHLITLHQRQQILEFKWVFSAFSNMLE